MLSWSDPRVQTRSTTGLEPSSPALPSLLPPHPPGRAERIRGAVDVAIELPVADVDAFADAADAEIVHEVAEHPPRQARIAPGEGLHDPARRRRPEGPVLVAVLLDRHQQAVPVLAEGKMPDLPVPDVLIVIGDEPVEDPPLLLPGHGREIDGHGVGAGPDVRLPAVARRGEKHPRLLVP